MLASMENSKLVNKTLLGLRVGINFNLNMEVIYG